MGDNSNNRLQLPGRTRHLRRHKSIAGANTAGGDRRAIPQSGQRCAVSPVCPYSYCVRKLPVLAWLSELSYESIFLRTRDMSEDRRERFAAYVEALAEVIGQTVPAKPLPHYCLGLLMPGERQSVGPHATIPAPARSSAKHQSSLHFDAIAQWLNVPVLSRILELTVPLIEGNGALEAWIIDDTGFPKKGRHSVGVAR